MNYYKIISDRKLLMSFIEDFLPDLDEPNERFYCALFARKKYTEEKMILANSGGKSQIERIIVRDKDRLLNKIERLEVPFGVYQSKDGQPIPQEALALYIHINPRDVHRAMFSAMKEFIDVGMNHDLHYDPDSNMRSFIHKTKSSKNSPFIVFDIDEKSSATLDKIHSILKGNHDQILATRGGFHVIIHKSSIPKIEEECGRMWYGQMMEISDQHGDVMIPVPGTVQGGHVPFFL